MRSWRAAVAVAVVAAGAVAGFGWWQARALRAVMIASVPARPAPGALPAEFAQRVASCAQRVRAGPGRAAALGELGRLYHANGFFAEASQCYQGLLRADPANPLWPHLLATVLAGYGQLEEALPLWRRTTKLAPDFMPARLRVADALLKLNREAEAAAAYSAVLDRDGQNAYALLGLARIDVAAQRWPAARERLGTVVALTDYHLGYDLLPTVCEHLGDNARAEAIRAQHKDSSAFFDLPDPWVDDLFYECYDTFRLIVAGGNADHAGNLPAAIRLLDRAGSIAPGDVAVQFELGVLHLKSRDFARARRQFERCTVLAPTFPDGWSELTGLLLKQGERAASDRALAAGLAHCPNSPGLHLEWARRLAAASRAAEAAREYQESIRLRPNEAEAYVGLANVDFQLGKSDEGLAALQQALAVEPEHPGALAVLAFYAIRNGDRAGAREWLRHIRLQPRVPPEVRDPLWQAFRQQFGQAPD